MPDQLLRQIALLKLVPRQPRKITTRELTESLTREGFVTTQRSVQRDLKRLAELFPDLHSDGNRDIAGWSWRREGAVAELPAMDPPVAFTFKLAEAFLQRLIPPSLLGLLRPYFDRSSKVLAHLDAPHLAGWGEKVRIVPRGQPLRPAEVAAGVIEVIYEALLEDRQFRGRYRRRDGDVAEYDFHPLGLVFRESVVYLVATVWDYQDPRHYALHRFEQCGLKEERSTRPAGFDLGAYVQAGGFDYVDPQAPRMRLRVLFDAATAHHLRETPLSEDQTIEAAGPGRVMVTASVHNSLQLRWWLRGFGAEVEVLEPAELREEFRVEAEELARRYA